jgi:hypothetical protein
MIARHLRTIATLAAPFALPVERISGRWLGSAQPADLVFAGSPETATFLAGALIEIGRRETLARLDTPLSLRSRSFETLCRDADLVAGEVPSLWQTSLPLDADFRMPAWVSQEIRAPDGAAIVLPAALRKEVNRHRRREQYGVRVTRNEADVRRFYAELYRPYVAMRYGTGAIIVDLTRFLAVSRGMQLALLCVGDEPVAGMLFRHRGATLALGWFGAATIPPASGASEVLDAFVIERAAAAGARRVILGHSRPSLADGVVRYKSRFGATLHSTRFPQRVIGIAVRRESAALAAAVNAARFVTFRGGARRIFELRSDAPLSAGFPESAPST